MHLTPSQSLRQAVVDNRCLWISAQDRPRRSDLFRLDITRVIVRGTLPVNPAAGPTDIAGMAQPSELRLSEVVAALSHALDLAAEGRTSGHAVRTCLIGMRLADEIGLPGLERSALLYGLLLKDAGAVALDEAAPRAAFFHFEPFLGDNFTGQLPKNGIYAV